MYYYYMSCILSSQKIVGTESCKEKRYLCCQHRHSDWFACAWCAKIIYFIGGNMCAECELTKCSTPLLSHDAGRLNGSRRSPKPRSTEPRGQLRRTPFCHQHSIVHVCPLKTNTRAAHVLHLRGGCGRLLLPQIVYKRISMTPNMFGDARFGRRLCVGPGRLVLAPSKSISFLAHAVGIN